MVSDASDMDRNFLYHGRNRRNHLGCLAVQGKSAAAAPQSSFSGQTPFEAAFRVTRRRYVVAGMVAATIAVLCSLAVALGAYLNMGVSN
jgi:hypothetical protein